MQVVFQPNLQSPFLEGSLRTWNGVTMRTQSSGTLATSFRTTPPITLNPTSSTAPTRPSSRGRCRSCCEYPGRLCQEPLGDNPEGDVTPSPRQDQQHGLQREPEANRRQQRVRRPAHDLLPHPPYAESHQAAAAAGRAFTAPSPPPPQHARFSTGPDIRFHSIYFLSSFSPQTICQKTKDKTAEYFAAVWALHAMSKVEAPTVTHLEGGGKKVLPSHVTVVIVASTAGQQL